MIVLSLNQVAYVAAVSASEIVIVPKVGFVWSILYGISTVTTLEVPAFVNTKDTSLLAESALNTIGSVPAVSPTFEILSYSPVPRSVTVTLVAL